MEIAFFDYEDELRHIIFAFEKKTEEGYVFTICNPRFEFETTFNYMEMLSLQSYFKKLKTFDTKSNVTDLKLNSQGILMRNTRLEDGDILFELILQRKPDTGFTKTISNIIFAPDMIAILDEILNAK